MKSPLMGDLQRAEDLVKDVTALSGLEEGPCAVKKALSQVPVGDPAVDRLEAAPHEMALDIEGIVQVEHDCGGYRAGLDPGLAEHGCVVAQHRDAF